MTRTIKREKRRYQRYSSDFKRKVAKEYLAGKASYAVLAEDHGLKSKSVVIEFVKWYRRKCELSPEKDTIMSDKKPTKSVSSVKDLEQQIKDLQRRLAYSELKVEALETMIDIAESELKVKIRKKSGAKQSKG